MDANNGFYRVFKIVFHLNDNTSQTFDASLNPLITPVNPSLTSFSLPTGLFEFKGFWVESGASGSSDCLTKSLSFYYADVCYEWDSFTLSLANSAGLSQQLYSGSQSKSVQLQDNTGGVCSNQLYFEIQYYPSSSTPNLISLSSSSQTSIVFSDSIDITDAAKYLVVVQAVDTQNNFRYETYYFSYTYIFDPLNICATADITVESFPFITSLTNQYINKPDFATIFSSVPVLFGTEFCGDFTVLDQTVITMPQNSVLQYVLYAWIQDSIMGLYSYDSFDPSKDAGRYVMNFVVCLELFPTRCVEFEQTFTVTENFECDATQVSASTVPNMVLNVGDPIAYYPLNGAFTPFPDSYSTSQSDPLFCPKIYTATISPADILTTFSFNATARQFLIYSDQAFQSGIYSVTLQGFIAGQPTLSSSTTFSLTVTQCEQATILLPEPMPSFSNMRTAVFEAVTQTPDYGVLRDSVSDQYGYGQNLCGDISFSITSTLLQAQKALSAEELKLSPSGKIEVLTTDIQKIGSHSVTITAFLVDYPEVELDLASFTIIITPPEVVDSPVIVPPVQRKPPYFQPALHTLTVTQCADDPKAQLWSFALPEIIDPQGSQVTVQVLLDSAFFMFDNPTKTISQIKIASNPTNQTMKVLLINEFNLMSINSMLVQFVCQTAVTPVFTFNFTFKDQKEKLAKQTYKPTARISKIDQTGLLFIQFDQKMQIPEHPEFLKTQSVSIDGESYQMLQFEVLPGKQSDKSLLNFNWTLVDFQVTQLVIQLEFENQNYVSSHNSDRDSIQVTINGYQLFSDILGNFMSPKTVLSPKQLPSMTSAAAMATAKGSADTASNILQAGMLANTVVMVFISGPLQQLLSSVKQLQIIVHIMLVNVAFPAVTTIYMGMFMNVLTFQFYDFSKFYDWVLRLDVKSIGNSPLNNQFNLMGYNSLYIVKNFGTLCWTIFLGPLAWVLYQILARLNHKKFAENKIKWNKRMKFNYWIGLINETYMFLAVCCGLNIFFYFKWSNSGDSFNSFIAICFGAAIILFPFFVAIWYKIPSNYKRILIKDEDFFARYGTAITGLNFKRHGWKVLVYQTVSILRKLWLALIVVCLQQYSVFSIIQINFQALIMMVVQGYTEPMLGISAGRLDLTNEAFVLIITYHLYQFTDFTTNLAMRDLVGKSVVYVTFANVGINIGVVAIQTALELHRKLKLKFLARKQRIQIARQRSAKLATSQNKVQLFDQNIEKRIQLRSLHELQGRQRNLKVLKPSEADLQRSFEFFNHLVSENPLITFKGQSNPSQLIQSDPTHQVVTPQYQNDSTNLTSQTPAKVKRFGIGQEPRNIIAPILLRDVYQDESNQNYFNSHYHDSQNTKNSDYYYENHQHQVVKKCSKTDQHGVQDNSASFQNNSKVSRSFVYDSESDITVIQQPATISLRNQKHVSEMLAPTSANMLPKGNVPRRIAELQGNSPFDNPEHKKIKNKEAAYGQQQRQVCEINRDEYVNFLSQLDARFQQAQETIWKLQGNAINKFETRNKSPDMNMQKIASEINQRQTEYNEQKKRFEMLLLTKGILNTQASRNHLDHLSKSRATTKNLQMKQPNPNLVGSEDESQQHTGTLFVNDQTDDINWKRFSSAQFQM